MNTEDFASTLPDLVKSLIEVRKNKRLGHAYIIVGDDIDYLKSFTKFWLKICLCTEIDSQSIPCNKCEHCLSIEKDTYPYRFELKPKSKTRMILIDPVREFEHHYHIKVPPEYLRVGIIWEAERMVEKAQNAFLKTLEEPNPQSLIIMITRNIRELLPTILSRCQIISARKNIYSYNFPENEKLFDILSELNLNSGALHGLKAATKINTLFATLKIHAKNLVEERDENEAWQEQAKDNRKLAKELEAEEIALIESEYRALRNHFLGAIHCWYSLILLIASKVPLEKLPNQEIIKNRLKNWMSTVKVSNAESALELADNLFRDLTATSMNEKMAIEDFFLQLTKKI